MSCLLIAAGCSEPSPPAPPRKAATNDVEVAHASYKFLEVQPAGEASVAASTRLPGRLVVRPESLLAVGVPAAGRVAAVHVRPGEAVSAGKVLLTIQSADATAARTDATQASVRVAAAEEALRRQNQMLAKGVGLEFERFEAETRAKEARAELERARRTAQLLGGGDGTTVMVRAPAAGVVMSVKTTVGAMVAPGGEAAVEIGDPARLSAVAEVGESEAAGVQRGQPVQVTVNATGQTIEGVVEGIGSGIDSTTRRLPVYVALRNVPSRLTPGMHADIALLASEQVLSLPAAAVLIKDGHRRVVYIEKSQGHFELREVRAGRASEGRILIHDGLKAGERVVVKGALLIDGEAEQAL